MRIGIPRALLYYQYFPMWKTFFENVGAEVTVSSPTTSETVASGCSRLYAELCLPVRVFCGHVLSLADNADRIFVPSVRSVEEKVYNCPKFIGLPDLIRAAVPSCPPILEPDIDVNMGKAELYRTIYRLGRGLTRNPWRIRQAAFAALRAQDEFEERMRLKRLTIPQAMADMPGEVEGNEKREAVGDITVALIGHPYLLHDECINRRLVTILKRLDVNILFPEMVGKEESRQALSRLVERPYWTYEDEVIGAGEHYLQSGTDGVISVAAFGCGPDSLMVELLRSRAQRLEKPFLNLIFDEHTAEAGLVTRLEAFVDMIRRRNRAPFKSVHQVLSVEGEREDEDGIGVLGIQSFGNVVAALRTVARMLDVPIVTPPVTMRTLSLGTKHSPEFACIPFKVILGNFIEALDEGANTLFMVTSVNACRLGYYAKVHEQILRDLGYEFRFLKFKNSDKGLVGVLKAIKRIANDAPWPTIIAAYRLGTAKLKALDDIERAVHKSRAVELEKGAADAVYRGSITAIDEAPNLPSLKETVAEYLGELGRIPVDADAKPLKVGVVGELYAVMEPFINMQLEKELGKLGVEVRRTRSTFLSEWTRLGSFNVLNEEKAVLKEFALPYLRRDVGGHGLESLAEKVRLSRQGYDGIVHLAPFTCMPEAIAQSIMPSTAENIPVLTILCDEQMAKSGLQTRLEAFVDLLNWRRRKLDRLTQFEHRGLR